MPKTLLAVDDSATMRKVMEITFSGEDFNVLTSPDKDGALAKLGDNPRVVLVDAALDSDGYSLAKEVRKRLPQAVIVILASRYAPYDQAKGKDAGADDFMDKPFDTQQIIDKVKKLLVTREAAGPVIPAASPSAPAARPAPVAPPQPAPVMARPVASPPAPPVAPSPAAPIAASRPIAPGTTAPPVTRSATLVFPHGSPPEAVSPPAQVPAPAAPPQRPAAGSPPVTVTHAVNGQMASKLGDLGLSQQQVDAVLALSRDVVERVVWEVVPQLAEAMIKEEIARLTKEG